MRRALIILVLLLAGCSPPLTYEQAKALKEYCESSKLNVEYTTYMRSKEIHSIQCVDSNGIRYNPEASK
jgi:hypothetical protein